MLHSILAWSGGSARSAGSRVCASLNSACVPYLGSDRGGRKVVCGLVTYDIEDGKQNQRVSSATRDGVVCEGVAPNTCPCMVGSAPAGERAGTLLPLRVQSLLAEGM